MPQLVENPESVGMSSARLTHIRPIMQSYIDRNGYSGISTLVARRGQIIYADQVGWQDREAGVPLGEDTIFRIYSMTKPVVYTALMLLYEEGRFQLIDPVAKFIPAFAATKVLGPNGDQVGQNPLRPMQVRDLMTHTSGLSYDFLGDSPVSALYREARLMADVSRSLADLVDELARLPLAFQPGTRWHYSLATDVAAQLIQILADMPLDTFLRERIFAPLGMDDTDYRVPAAKRGRLAAMYGHRLEPGTTLKELFRRYPNVERGRIEIDERYPADLPGGFLRGNIGLFSTTSDYMRFAMMLLSGRAADGTRIIGRKTLELMHQNHLPQELLPYAIEGLASPGYGFGLGSRVCLDVAQTGVSGSVGEFGWIGAAGTYYWVDPQEQLVGLLMTQFLMGVEQPHYDLRNLVYQAIND